MRDDDSTSLDLTCESVRDLLPDRLGGRLSVGENRSIDTHLAGCPDCAAEARLLEALRRHRPEPRPDLAARVKARLRTEIPAPEFTHAAGEAPREHEGRPRAAPGVTRPSTGGSDQVGGRRAPSPRNGFAGGGLRRALPAAAVVALAISGLLFWRAREPADLSRGAGRVGDPAALLGAAGDPLPSVFPSDDGVLAGAPLLDDLSDDALERLVEELEG